MLEEPESPRSAFSDLSSSPPMLDVSTLSILNSFMAARDQERALFNQLVEQHAAIPQPAEVDLEDAEDDEVKPMISVDEYRIAFREDWQLSQFWYSTESATHLARSIRSICQPDNRIAFLCCPTGFVAFQHENSWKKVYLLEYDTRFAVLDPKRYVQYDIDEPDVFPEGLRGKVDLIVADPPFLNEVTNRKLTTTCKQLLNPNGKLLLLTSSSVEDLLPQIYIDPPLGPLRKSALKVSNGQLANDYGCWGSWAGAESFGGVAPDKGTF